MLKFCSPSKASFLGVFSGGGCLDNCCLNLAYLKLKKEKQLLIKYAFLEARRRTSWKMEKKWKMVVFKEIVQF